MGSGIKNLRKMAGFYYTLVGVAPFCHGSGTQFCTNSTLVLVPVCGLKTLPYKPTTAKIRQCPAINSRICLSLQLLKRPCGNTTAMRQPGFKKLRLLSMNKISRPTVDWYLPLSFLPNSYFARMRVSLMSPANGGFAINISKPKSRLLSLLVRSLRSFFQPSPQISVHSSSLVFSSQRS